MTNNYQDLFLVNNVVDDEEYYYNMDEPDQYDPTEYYEWGGEWHADCGYYYDYNYDCSYGYYPSWNKD